MEARQPQDRRRPHHLQRHSRHRSGTAGKASGGRGMKYQPQKPRYLFVRNYFQKNHNRSKNKKYYFLNASSNISFPLIKNNFFDELNINQSNKIKIKSYLV